MTDPRDYAFRARLDVSYEQALEAVADALKAEGFGILTSVDMKATLKTKLDADFRKYSILGVCNPPLALNALTKDMEAGLMLPCTMVVYEDDGGTSVAVAAPEVVAELLGNPKLSSVAEEAQAKLERVIGALTGRSA